MKEIAVFDATKRAGLSPRKVIYNVPQRVLNSERPEPSFQ